MTDQDVVVMTPAEVYEAVRLAFMSLAAGAREIADASAAVEPERRAQIVERAAATLARVADQTSGIIAQWLHEPDFVTPELVAAEEDPGDLTCPRCDGPIGLAELRDAGICGLCLAEERGERVPQAVDVPTSADPPASGLAPGAGISARPDTVGPGESDSGGVAGEGPPSEPTPAVEVAS